MPTINILASDYPPGFEGLPWLYAATVFSLLIVNILALEWMWRLSWSLYERPYTLKHPVTVTRVILFALILGALIRSGPDVLWLTMWQELDISGRNAMLHFDDVMDALAFVPWTIAWLAAYLGSPIVNHQLTNKPIPVHLWPSRSQIIRPLKIVVAVLAITLAITFFG